MYLYFEPTCPVAFFPVANLRYIPHLSAFPMCFINRLSLLTSALHLFISRGIAMAACFIAYQELKGLGVCNNSLNSSSVVVKNTWISNANFANILSALYTNKETILHFFALNFVKGINTN